MGKAHVVGRPAGPPAALGRLAAGTATCGRRGGSRNDPQRVRYGCFLPDLTGLANVTSARLPRHIWAKQGQRASRRWSLKRRAFKTPNGLAKPAGRKRIARIFGE